MFIQAVLGQLPDRPTTEFVTDGEDLLHRIASTRPDLVVLDLPLAKIDGLEVLARLHGRPDPPPVVVFSESDDRATMAACQERGARRYVVKSGDFRQFRAAVHDIASSAQASSIKEAPVQLLA